MTKSDKLKRDFEYAKAHFAYTGNFTMYVLFNYDGYVATCMRMEILPMSMQEWLDSNAS